MPVERVVGGWRFVGLDINPRRGDEAGARPWCSTTCATHSLAASAGHPITTVQAWMGHADVETTMIYAHYSPAANEAEALNRLIARPRTTDQAERMPRES